MKLSTIQARLQSSIQLKQAVLKDEALLQQVIEIAELIKVKLKEHQRLLLCGNGGSASDALHLAAEFSGRYYLDRPALSAEALNVNEAALTAISNDYSFEQLFVRLLESKGKKGDVLWVFSTSGNSPNMVNALKRAKELEITTIAFTGQDGGLCKDNADYIIKVPSKDTPRIQEAHITIGHIICELVESALFGK